MPRNLLRRIEVACPIYNKGIQEELRAMLKFQLRDNTKARILDNELQNNYSRSEVEGRFRAQEDFYQYIKEKHQVIMKIYHNPRCAKSRAGLQYMEENGFSTEIVNYIKEGISEKEIRHIMQLTGMSASELVRTQDKIYRAEYKDKELTDDEWVKVLSEKPQLLKRPIVVNGKKAILAQPADLIDKIL